MEADLEGDGCKADRRLKLFECAHLYEGMLQPLLHTSFSPFLRQIHLLSTLHDVLGAAVGEVDNRKSPRSRSVCWRSCGYLSVGEEVLCGVGVSAPDQVLTQQHQLFVDVVVNGQVAGVHDAHVHAHLRREEESRWERLSPPT